MRILLVHPEDSVIDEPWSISRWDLVVDLGWAGTFQYAEWGARLGCVVRSLFSFANWHEDVPLLPELCGIGKYRLLDGEGIDWWELLAPIAYQRVYEFLLLQKVAREIKIPAEIHITRPHPLGDAIGKMVGVNVVPFISTSESSAIARFIRFKKKLRALTPSQIVQIACDKWDTDYRVRRYFTRRGPRTRSKTKILLPSAYRNVSRVLARYAQLLPDRDFLMVTTRADGELKELPSHISSAPLAAYALRSTATEREIADLTRQWETIKKRLYATDIDVSLLGDSLEALDPMLRNGLRLRDAWRAVFEREKIDSVLCADENNVYTRLPVLLAHRRGVHTVYCSHGALDSTILLRGICSDTYLAKGEMERDYLIRECEVPQERIFVGAPPGSHLAVHGLTAGTHIVFFSEPYELYHGRTETLYREVLRRLCAIGREHGRKVMLKLHPFESMTARSQLVDRLLTDSDRKLLEVTSEPISEQLLRKTWFSLTVESSVAVECALAGVPSFLCGWFDIDLYSYGKQYERFGAAQILHRPDDISRIPVIMESQQTNAAVRDRLYHPISR
jgi:hypothetical protein